MNVITELHSRNELLFWFGTAHLLLAAICIVMSYSSGLVVNGSNAWYKPTKFALSIGIYALTMGWMMDYLNRPIAMTRMSWIIVVLLGLEMVYIVVQAGRGLQSHFNLSTPIYRLLYVGMAAAASGISLLTFYTTILFFKSEFPELDPAYLWAIRLGMLLFVIFSFEGFVMGSRLSHTIGGPDGGPSLKFLGWSVLHGDPRIPHFIGMHAMQILPLAAHFVLKDVRWIAGLAAVYTLLAVYTLVLALSGKPLIDRSAQRSSEQTTVHHTH